VKKTDSEKYLLDKVIENLSSLEYIYVLAIYMLFLLKMLPLYARVRGFPTILVAIRMKLEG